MRVKKGLLFVSGINYLVLIYHALMKLKETMIILLVGLKGNYILKRNMIVMGI